MIQRVYFRETEDRAEIAIAENGVLEQYYRLENGFLTGSVFVGKVKFVKKQVGVFIDLGLEKDGLLTYREGLAPGDLVLVQVIKEPTEEKGCALTEKLTLPGRYVVLNDVEEYNFSKKLTQERKIELFSLPRKEGVGFIFRSACENASFDSIRSECEFLINEHDKIVKTFLNTAKITCLYRDSAKDVAKRFAHKEENFSEKFDEIKEQVEKIGERKVYINGVELVFDKTEAMTVVDVNIHTFNKAFADVETSSFQANLLAVKELARQLRLRNIGGIIMVDFISMKRRENFEKLRDALLEELKKDNVKTTVEAVESIGLFAIVRTRRYASL